MSKFTVEIHRTLSHYGKVLIEASSMDAAESIADEIVDRMDWGTHAPHLDKMINELDMDWELDDTNSEIESISEGDST